MQVSQAESVDVNIVDVKSTLQLYQARLRIRIKLMSTTLLSEVNSAAVSRKRLRHQDKAHVNNVINVKSTLQLYHKRLRHQDVNNVINV
jgi:hypothetical protein